MERKQLAVILPGIGYHKDRPLLYYAAKLAQAQGFDILHIAYHDMPQKIRGNAEMMREAALLACQQTEEQILSADLSAYDGILLIGKSIGTIAAAKFAAEHAVSAKQIWYTPLTAAFTFRRGSDAPCIAFLGEEDPWSDIGEIRREAEDQQIPLSLYPGCNHSLECADVLRNIDNLREVMQITADFISA